MDLSPPCPITTNHQYSSFNCGNSTLNDWLKRKANKNQNRGASRTLVVCNNETIIGYYALAVGSISRQESAPKVSRNMPEPIPVMILGRLAVDVEWQGKHIGSGLLKDVIQRTIIVSEQTGVRALIVHALSKDAKTFYQHRGFYESPVNDMTLMITINEAKQSLGLVS